ncbi:hypothetical protein [Streptomyces sp. NPDC054834]
MPVPSESPETEPGRAGLPVIGLAAARELFRTAESSGLGRPGTDEIFDQWLDDLCDIAFYRNADRPLQARAVNRSGEVSEWLYTSRVGGRARLEAVCLNPSRPAPPPDEEPAEETDEADEVDETDAGTCDGMPGLCWNCEPDVERYAKVDSHRDHENGDDPCPCALELVNAYAGGMAQDPSFGLSGELPPDFRADSIRGLTVLAEVAQRKLDTERWDTDGPWRVTWFRCESDVTNPVYEGEEESGVIHYCASIESDDDVPTVQVMGTRWGEQHIFYHEPLSEPGGELPDTGTLEGLRHLLERATEQVGEAGYKVDGEWTVGWSRCHVLLADWDR